MMKQKKLWIDLSIVYAFLALACGVFYREFTKWSGYEGKTALKVIHPHYLVLGTLFLLILIVFEELYSIAKEKHFSIAFWLEQIGLNITVIAFFIRGITQVKQMTLSHALDASISGIAGVGHTLLAIGLVWMLFLIRKAILARRQKA